MSIEKELMEKITDSMVFIMSDVSALARALPTDSLKQAYVIGMLEDFKRMNEGIEILKESLDIKL